METLSILFRPGRLTGRVAVPGSKSISNRLLVMAYLGGMDYHPVNLSTADDTVLMQKLLDEVAAHRVSRASAADAGAVRLDCANAGTVLRFLTALLAFEPGEWLLDGSPRMRRRPIGPLVSALQAAGADIRYVAETGFPPLHIRGVSPVAASAVSSASAAVSGGASPVESTGDAVSSPSAASTERIWNIDASLSSQYVSALMLAACRIPEGVRLRMTGERASQPYIRMTAALLRAAGVEVGDTEAAEFKVCGLPSAALPPYVEPDWSSASYFYGLLALGEGGELFLPGLTANSCQGDSIVAEWFKAWGIESRFESGGLRLCRRENRCPATVAFDFTHQPDLLQTMAVVCAGSGTEARFTGVKNLRYKETDRLTAVVTELNRLGFVAELHGEDEMTVGPSRKAAPSEQTASSSGHPKTNTSPLIHTYGDHRMALAFSMLAVLRPVTIENPAVVRKSFDTYWTSLASLGAEMDLR